MTTFAMPRTSPEEQGIASAAVLRFIEAIENQVHDLHSFMLLRHGSVVAEGWWSPYGRERLHIMYSLSKSFTSTAVGLAVSEGCFSLDDRVLSFFPEDAPAEVSDFLAQMQVRHLLSMSTGHADDTYRPMVARADGNWNKQFFEMPVRYAPGTHFLYNTGATYILSAIVQKTTGLKLIDYLRPRLFEPLGITSATWEESPQGVSLGGIGLRITTEDIARFGQLYLQKGNWQGKQIIPEAWIVEATAKQISNGDLPDSDWTQGYGYQFWRCQHNGYRGDGAFGQYCIILPEQDAVVAITGGVEDMQQPLNVLWDILLPAMGSEALEANPDAQQRLAERLTTLNLSPVQGKAASPIAAQISGSTYRVEANELEIEAVTLAFNEEGSTIKLKTATGDQVIAAGYGAWKPSGATALFNPLNKGWLPEAEAMRIVASGAWTADDRYTMVVRLDETPFYFTVALYFMGDEAMIEGRINVTFETRRDLLLTARRA